MNGIIYLKAFANHKMLCNYYFAEEGFFNLVMVKGKECLDMGLGYAFHIFGTPNKYLSDFMK